MDALSTLKPQNVAGFRQEPQVSNVPAPAFGLIWDLLSQNSDRRTIHSWIEIVHRQYLYISQYGTHSDQCTYDTPHTHGSSEKSPPSLVKMPKGRYVCYSCHERLGTAKEYRRHMEEKCEPLCTWNCPHCEKTYRRRYNLATHHKSHHECDQTGTTHLKDAAQYITPKSVFGCGYCVRWFDRREDFINHLAKHFKDLSFTPQWDDTTRIQSLLSHRRYQAAWNNICATRFNTIPEHWPRLIWTLREVEKEVHSLHYGIDGQDMAFCLAKLLEKGLGFGYAKPSPLSRNIDVKSWNNNLRELDSSPIVLSNHGAVGYMMSTMSSPETESMDLDDIMSSTPSTLVNTEDFWPATNLTSAYGVKKTDTESYLKMPLDPFDPLPGSNNDFTEFVTFDSPEEDARLDTGLPWMSSTMKPAETNEINGPDIEDIVMSSIPMSNPLAANTMCVDQYFVPSTVNPMDTFHPSPGLHETNLDTDLEQMLPYNPTPPLHGRKSHRRSLSDRLKRAFCTQH